MKKIENWNELDHTEDVSNFSELERTQYIVKIIEATDEPSKEKLVIKYDICGMKHFKELAEACPILNDQDKKVIQDKLKEQDDKDMYGFFYKQMEAFGDWPWRGLLHKSYKETAQRFFTKFITAIEKSTAIKKNSDGTYQTKFKFAPSFDESKLVGKFFIANFGYEEYEKEGKVLESIKCRDERSILAFVQGKVKDLKLKKLSNSTKDNIDTGNFNDIEDDLPF
jgi:hypothetical protein